MNINDDYHGSNNIKRTKLNKWLYDAIFGCLATILIVIFIYSIIFLFAITFLELDISMLIFATALFFCALLAGILHFFFIGPSFKNPRYLVISMLFLFATGILIEGIGWWTAYPLLTGLSRFLISIGIVIGITTQISAIPKRSFFKGVFSLMAIIFLSFLLIPSGSVGMKIVLRYLYTPPAITNKKISAYCDFLNFVKKHQNLVRFELAGPNIIIYGDGSFFIDSSTFAEKTKTFFSTYTPTPCQDRKRENLR